MDPKLTSRDWQGKLRELEAGIPRLETALNDAECDLHGAQLAVELGERDDGAVDTARKTRDNAKANLDSRLGAVAAAQRNLNSVMELETVEKREGANAEIERIGQEMIELADKLEISLRAASSCTFGLTNLIGRLSKARRSSLDQFLHPGVFPGQIREYVVQSLPIVPSPERREPIDLSGRIAAEIGALRHKD